MKGNGTRSPDAIIADIEQIRSEMDSTLLAIEERLAPGQVIDQGLDYLRNSGGREYLSNLGASVKTHPLPATLAGVALAWLMVTTQRDSRSEVGSGADQDRTGLRSLPGEPLSPGYGSAGMSEKAGELRAKAGDLSDRVTDTAASVRDRVSDAVYSARNRATDTAQRARDLASGTAQHARDAYARTAETAREQVDRARSGYRQLMQEQPLALGAIGIGVGALFAALAPRTRPEDEMMGNAADAVKHRVAEAGHEQLNRAGEIMRSAPAQDRAPDTDQGRTEAPIRGANAASTGLGSMSSPSSAPARTEGAATAARPSAQVPPLTGANMARPSGARVESGPLDE